MQHINLYLPELRPKKEFLTANMLVISTVGLCLVLAMASWTLTSDLEKKRSRVIELENQKVVVQQQIDEIKKVPRVSDEIKLDQQLTELRASIRSRKQLGQIIIGQNFGNEAGFSKVLESMARQSQRTMSLEQIRISGSGRLVEFRGLTLQPENVPTYLQDLQAEESFDGVRFGLLSVAQDRIGQPLSFAVGFEPVYAQGSGVDK